MSKTTFRALLTVVFIMVAGVLLMLSDDGHRAKVQGLVNQVTDYVEGAKAAATSAVDNAQKGFGEAKDALNRAQ